MTQVLVAVSQAVMPDMHAEVFAAVHWTQVWVVVLQAGVAPEQLVSVVQATQVLVVVSQTGVEPVHAEKLVAVHCTQVSVVASQAGAPAEQSASTVQATQVSVDVSHTGVAPVHVIPPHVPPELLLDDALLALELLLDDALLALELLLDDALLALELLLDDALLALELLVVLDELAAVDDAEEEEALADADEALVDEEALDVVEVADAPPCPHMQLPRPDPSALQIWTPEGSPPGHAQWTWAPGVHLTPEPPVPGVPVLDPQPATSASTLAPTPTTAAAVLHPTNAHLTFRAMVAHPPQAARDISATTSPS